MNKLINYGRGPREVFAQGETLDFRQGAYARPRNTVAPKITGTPAVGQILTRVAGSWTGAAVVSWEWQANGQFVAGGLATYTVQAADAGKTITLVERAITVQGLGASSRSAGVAIP